MGIECGECERDLRGGHDPSCSRYRPCVCPVCLSALEDGDGYLWCREHGEVSPLENHKAIATIVRLTAERDEARASAAAAYERAEDWAFQHFTSKTHGLYIRGKLRALATEAETEALAEMLDAETRACAEIAQTSKEECMWAELNDEARVLRSMQLAILARIDQRKEAE